MIDKPAGPTSHDVVARVRRVTRERSVGHAGTLDPFATGLLVVLVGGATRLARFVEQQVKGYLAEAVLGIVTDTDDATGSVIRQMVPGASWPDRVAVQEALTGLTGTYLQRPPAFSARRVAGKRAYHLARAGLAVDLPATEVRVDTVELVAWEPPSLRFRVAVSAGTYVRAMARDLGDRLGVGAHLSALRREWIGPLRVEDAVPLDGLGPETPLLPPLALVRHLPQVLVDQAEAAWVRQGRLVSRQGAAGEAALVADGALVAIAAGGPLGWQPRVVVPAA